MNYLALASHNPLHGNINTSSAVTYMSQHEHKLYAHKHEKQKYHFLSTTGNQQQNRSQENNSPGKAQNNK